MNKHNKSETDTLVDLITAHFAHQHPEGLRYKKELIVPLAKKIITWHKSS